MRAIKIINRVCVIVAFYVLVYAAFSGQDALAACSMISMALSVINIIAEGKTDE